MNRLLLAAMCLFCGIVQASDPDFTFAVHNGKYYLLVIENGSPIAHPVSVRLVTFEGGDIKPPPPPADTLTDRGKAIRDSAQRVSGDPKRDETAQMLAVLYSEIAKKVRSGEVKTPELILKLVKGTADMLLQQRSVLDPWKPTRQVLSDQWTAQLQVPKNTDEDFAILLDEAAAGLNASVPKSSSVKQQAIDIRTILEIIKFILDLLNKQSTMGGAR